MEKTTVIHSRVSPEVKKNAETILKILGLNTSKAINLFLNQVVIENGLPFELKIPNNKEKRKRETIAYALNRTGGKDISQSAKKIISLYINGDLEYDVAKYALSKDF